MTIAATEQGVGADRGLEQLVLGREALAAGEAELQASVAPDVLVRIPAPLLES
jgi:hypothetical protein